MKNILFIVLAVLCLSCTPRKPAIPPQETYLRHTIAHNGETLGIIARWYTGKSINWMALESANPELKANRLKMGQVVKIPTNLVIKQDPLTKEFVASNTNIIPSTSQQALDSGNTQIVQLEEVKKTDTDSAKAMLGQEADQEIKQVQNPERQLINAVMFSDLEQVKRLLQAGTNPNLKENDRPLLGWASQNGNMGNDSVEVVKALISAGADVNALDGIGHTALMRAVDTMQLGITQALISAKADVNIKAPNGKTALFLAVDNNNLEIVNALIVASADVNILSEDEISPILAATQNGAVEIIKALALAKANLNVSNIIYTPLIYAIEQGNLELVNLLLSLGADPNAKAQNGGAPLAQAFSSPDIFKALLGAKANVNVKDSYGQNILMNAILNNSSTELIQEIVNAGADLSATDNNGNTALMLAESNMKTEIVPMLSK